MHCYNLSPYPLKLPINFGLEGVWERSAAKTSLLSERHSHCLDAKLNGTDQKTHPVGLREDLMSLNLACYLPRFVTLNIIFAASARVV